MNDLLFLALFGSFFFVAGYISGSVVMYYLTQLRLRKMIREIWLGEYRGDQQE